MNTFGIIMPVYYGDDFDDIASTLTHVISCQFDEVLVVRDGHISLDLEDLLNHFEEVPNVKILRLEKNLGLGSALREAVNALQADFFFRIDAGDYLIVNEVENTKRIIIEKNLDLIGGQMGEFVDDPEKIVHVRKVPVKFNEIVNFAKYRNPFNHITVCAKRSSVLAAGNYRTDTLLFEDYSLWISMLEKNMKILNRVEVLAIAKLGLHFSKRRTGSKYFNNEIVFLRKNFRFFGIYAILFAVLRLPSRLIPSLSKTLYYMTRSIGGNTK